MDYFAEDAEDVAGEEEGGSYLLGPEDEQVDLSPEEINAFLNWTVAFTDHLIDHRQDRRCFGYNVSMLLERNKPRHLRK